MDFLKNLNKHYEKVILVAVLLGLAAAAALLPGMISQEQERLAQEAPPPPQNPKAIEETDLTKGQGALSRQKSPPRYNFSLPHNLFNPVRWMQRPDGTLIPVRTGSELGPGAVVVPKITPLYTIIAYEGVFSATDNPQYKFGITQEAEKSPSKQRRTPRTVPLGGKCEFFVVKEVEGPADDPVAFKLELTDGKKLVTVTKEQPYREVAGYMADLKYEPEKLSFNGKRVGDKLVFAGDTNNVVAITESNVVLSALSTTKRTTRPLSTAP